MGTLRFLKSIEYGSNWDPDPKHCLQVQQACARLNVLAKISLVSANASHVSFCIKKKVVAIAHIKRIYKIINVLYMS